jgi:hypothetical protein
MQQIEQAKSAGNMAGVAKLQEEDQVAFPNFTKSCIFSETPKSRLKLTVSLKRLLLEF